VRHPLQVKSSSIIISNRTDS